MNDSANPNGLNHLTIDEIEKEINVKFEKREISRRELLKGIGKAAGFIFIGGFLASRFESVLANVENIGGSAKIPDSKSNAKIKTTVIRVTSPKSVDSSGEGKDGPVADMVSRAILELTGEKDIAKAWGHIAKKGDRVGLKVNCISGRYLSTQVPVAMAVVAGLKKAGVREQDIIIWDRTDRELTRAGYTLNSKSDALKCLGTDQVGYQKEEQDINGTKFKLSKILTDEIDVLINIPILKNHGGAGITLSLKNNYGSHSNPGDHHRYFCDPDCPNINAHPVIKTKTKLIVVDVLRAQCNGGPGDKPRWKWNPGMIMMGFDPVAIDQIGCEIIDTRRLEVGLDLLGQSTRHINTAAKLGLGTDDRNAILVKDFTLS